MPRFRDLGAVPGALPSGPLNAITDVAGVRVGHTTLIEGDAIRTGVTAILPHDGHLYAQKVPAAVYTVNGFGKVVGFEQVRELGSIEAPVLLTSTLNVGKVADALVSYMLAQHPEIGTVNPLVGECNDGYLSDISGRHVGESHVIAAIESAQGGAVAEGCVGAGTGTSCYSFKGGIGTASRVAPDGYRVGALVQTNFGTRSELTMLGVPLGLHLADAADNAAGKDGSVMMVLATDAPLTSRQLERLARRASFGIARTGTVCHHGSGDFVIAFSTAYTVPFEQADSVLHLPDNNAVFNPLFQAVVEVIEEAVYNAQIAAETMSGQGGRVLSALPHDAVVHWLRHYRRLA